MTIFFRSGADAPHQETCPTVGALALPAENHPSEFLAKALDLLRIGFGSEMLGKFNERLFLLLFRFDAFFKVLLPYSFCRLGTRKRGYHFSR